MTPRDRPVVPEPAHTTIHTGRIALPGDVAIPAKPHGGVVLAHAHELDPLDPDLTTSLFRAGLATLSLDLMTDAEETANRYPREPSSDATLMGRRLAGAIAWIASQPGLHERPIGLLGIDGAAAAALYAAAEPAQQVRAVVIRGGRPDLAWAVLPNLSCPTLLIVGSEDAAGLAAARAALERLNATSQLHVVLGAGATFDAPGARDEVRTVALRWLRTHLMPPAAAEDDQAAAEDEQWDH